MLSPKRFTGAWIAAMTLTACATSTQPSPEKPGPSPLVVASCPKLTPLLGPTFAETTLKLIEIAGLYRECRAAALGATP